MTLMPVESSPILRMISKAAQIDPEGTHELVRLALYESLCEQIDYARGQLDQDCAAYVAKNVDAQRRALVRTFVERRITGQGVEDLLEVSKSASPTTAEDRKHGWFRDLLGRFTSKTTNAQGHLSTWAENGVKDDPFDRPRYANLRATGAVLAGMGDTTGLGAAAAAVGSFGPEAEKVLGNGLRRTAYRFRGTEKRPDKGLKDEIKNGLGQIDPANAEKITALRDAEADNELRGRSVAGKPFDKDRSSVRRQTNKSPSVGVVDYYESKGKNLSAQQREMRVAGDIASAYYLEKLPNEQSTSIAIAAGRVPPSQGVIIDADGDVVSEAMGYNGDHYVPFDLKNLRSLQGGQYVRTRAVGGPTSEDIYTGLLAGARQIQVVSQSGVFTVEFDPTLRGGRRYSDKARQMVSRYERILDAIDQSKTSGLYQNDITPKERRDIQTAAAARYSGDDLDKVVELQITRLRESKQFKYRSDDEIVVEAKANLGNSSMEGLKDEIASITEQNRTESVKRFQLDGDGYEAALEALKTEFPYFVRTVKRERLPDFSNKRGLGANVRYSGATDQGYVAPSTKATGRARSVNDKLTTIDQPSGRAAEPVKPKQGDSTEGGTTEGAGDAPAATRAALGFGVAVKQREAQRVATIAGGQLDQQIGLLAHGAMNEKGEEVKPVVLVGFGNDVQDDSEFKLMDDAQALFAVHERAGKSQNVLDHLAQAGPNERAAYIRALGKMEDVAKEHGLKDPAGMKVAADKLQAVVATLQPFGPPGDPADYRPDEHHFLPMEVASVAACGLDPAKYEAFESDLLTNQNVMALIESYTDAGDEMGKIADTEIADAQAEHKADPTEINAKEVMSRQLAFAYAHAKRLAKRYYEATEQDWDTVGKTLAGPESAASPSSRPFRKRDVRWHSPGSDLALEFQRFLASR